MTHRRPPSRRRGYAMLVVMLLILTTTGMAAVHARQLAASLRIEQARRRSEARSRGPTTALAIACQRIETGNPTDASASFQYSHHDGFQTVLYRISYQAVGPDKWTVTAEPDPAAGTLPPLPASF
ncbi:hypothetical protein NZK35_05385 [Stieleria sp. ICT_E10.1]|uniref:hypothetical protein n=1 Tax=Stieleria sedimenti TaxID=2976331 RepID=UPI0021805502|nr:hypothetical protein [Stieleria sedimenti]MCS7466106.1 hypothetical protein [Stieleria sedimenti]